MFSNLFYESVFTVHLKKQVLTTNGGVVLYVMTNVDLGANVESSEKLMNRVEFLLVS